MEIVQRHGWGADMVKRGYGGADGKEASAQDGRAQMHFDKVFGCRMEGTDSLCVDNLKVAEAVLDAEGHSMLGMVVEMIRRLLYTDDLRHRKEHLTAQKMTKLFVAYPAVAGGLWVSQRNAREAVEALDEDGQSEKEQYS